MRRQGTLKNAECVSSETRNYVQVVVEEFLVGMMFATKDQVLISMPKRRERMYPKSKVIIGGQEEESFQHAQGQRQWQLGG